MGFGISGPGFPLRMQTLRPRCKKGRAGSEGRRRSGPPRSQYTSLYRVEVSGVGGVGMCRLHHAASHFGEVLSFRLLHFIGRLSTVVRPPVRAAGNVRRDSTNS